MDADIAIGRRITVHSIADDRVPDGGAVDVQLVSPGTMGIVKKYDKIDSQWG